MNFYDILFARKMANQGDITTEGLSVTENGTYTAPTGKAYTPVVVAVEGYAKKSIENTPTAIATFNASALPMPSLTVGIEATQSGTGDPSPTNVRPISGWSAVNVYDTSVNLLGGTALVDAIHATMPSATVDTTDETITFNGSTDTSANKVISDSVVFKPNTQYTFINIGTTGAKGNFRWLYTDDTYDAAGDVVIGAYVSKANKSVKALIKINNTNQNTVLKYNTCGIFEGDLTAQDFVPYSGTTYTTALKDGQGNPMECYGGQFENVNGQQKLTNTYDAVDMGDLNWTYSNGFFRTTDLNSLMKMPIDNNTKANIISEQYTVDTWNHITASMSGKMAKSRSSAEALMVCDTNYTDVASFKNAVTGVKLMYELATPQQIPQDNLAIATQEGTNNLWADTGDVLSGEYLEAL